VSTPVEVPDFTDQALTMSDFAVSTSREDRSPVTLVADSALRIVLPVLPTGRRRFRPDDRLVVFNQIQDEHSLLSQKLDVRWTVASDDGEILKRDSSTLESKPQQRGRFHSTVAMKALKPGVYVLTVEAYSTSGPPAIASRSSDSRSFPDGHADACSSHSREEGDSVDRLSGGRADDCLDVLSARTGQRPSLRVRLDQAGAAGMPRLQLEHKVSAGTSE
jgi:hypothetical protein